MDDIDYYKSKLAEARRKVAAKEQELVEMAENIARAQQEAFKWQQLYKHLYGDMSRVMDKAPTYVEHKWRNHHG